MKRAAFEKATDRVTSAKARLGDLEKSKSYRDARRCWYEFLISSNAVFSILEQGAKGDGKSEYWFGKKRRERKDDKLLRYMHHARNAEEHNTPSVTDVDRQKMVMVANGQPVAAIEDMVGNQGKFRQLSDDAPDMTKVTELRIYPERAKLIRVRDRGVDYDPPDEHLGTAIDDGTPIEVARLMTRYIEQMLIEVNGLIVD